MNTARICLLTGILMTGSLLAYAQAVPPAQYCGKSNTEVCGKQNGTGDYWDIFFSGYVKFRFGRGGKFCGAAGAGCQGIYSFWDAQNDPSLLHEMWTEDVGIFQHQANSINNANGSRRHSEIKEPGGPTQTITINEQNNVRMKWTQTGPTLPYGAAQYPADINLQWTITYVAYRHGTGVATGAGKIYRTTTLYYDGLDNKGPLAFTQGMSWYLDLGWWSMTGEPDPSGQNKRSGCGQFFPFTPSPFNNVYESSGDYRNKHWILVSANVPNSSRNLSEQFPGELPCWNPSGPNDGSKGQLPPGHVTACTTPNSPAGCGTYPQPDSGIVLHTNYLQVSHETICHYMSLGPGTAVYFLGGIRFYCESGSFSIPSGGSRTWRNVAFIGDNGITSEATANAFAAEYTGSKMNGEQPSRISGATFDPTEGYWSLPATTATKGFSTAGNTLHSPAFNVTGWTAGVPDKIRVGSAAKLLNTDFVAVKRDPDTLLLQALFNVAAGTTIAFPSGGESTPTVSSELPQEP